MLDKLRCIPFIAASLAVLAVFMGAARNEGPEPEAYVLMEADTRSVLNEKNADKRLNAGYLSKLMGILLIAEDIESGKYSADDELTASESVANTKGAVIWLESGDKMTVDELLKSVIIGNANDAMTVLAENSSGGIEAFVMDMNSRAFDLGLRDTWFVSPYGYYSENEYTTAYDMAVICCELAEHDFLTPYFSTWRDFVKGGKTELVSENTLTRTYDRHIGFKACHSDEAGFCAAEGGRNEQGTTFVSVVLGAENEDISLGNAKKLLKGGFSGYKVTFTMFPDEMLVPVKVKNGTASAVEIYLREQGKAAVPKGSGELRARVVIPEYLTAPVRIGQPIGCAAFYNDDMLVYETELLTKSGVSELSYKFILCKLLEKFIEK
ncbi:MAG: D-alanyl-D-alanine carboxypeptidase [Ruminococcus sp.]|uniref:D-alanyl-D-alanine carboxypeptidase family protein n=1 Tax=Ruminococcus flavefaciens TaxID=1265 RepID=UPI0026F2AE3D|nr:serine hydrolase [Ruminococcus flavefaciens]MBR0511230.1 D-alanyl-D-alanine carboxypeptidase [Ruminococcus sp.]